MRKICLKLYNHLNQYYWSNELWDCFRLFYESI